MPRRLRRIGILGTGIGVLGVALSLTPAVLLFEESAGLAWLFRTRGPVPPPDDVVVVNIAADSAAALGLTSHVDRWPRALHARLVRRLAEAGARVVAFDIIFDSAREPDGDRQLAEALARAGNAILVERLDSDVVDLRGVGPSGSAIVERRVPPIEPLRRAALATAPFILPVVPIRVSQFWTFGRTADDPPATLPVVVLQAFALPVLDELLGLLGEVRPGLQSTWAGLRREAGEKGGPERMIRALRDAFRSDPRLGPDLQTALEARRPPADRRRLLAALIGMYSGPDSRFLDYYGPARSIRTVPYHEALNGLSAAEMKRLFRGKAVFVGFSESKQPAQQDWFFSVFSKRSGQNLSGVEIGATAFANLLEGRSVRPLALPEHWAVVFAWGLAIAALGSILPVFAALPAGLAAAGLYASAARLGFIETGAWPPLAVPLLVQLPVALFAGLMWSYQSLRRQRERIQAALGYYLPQRAVERLAHETARAAAEKELVFGTCLVTDAEQYTTLSESLSPEVLGRLMDEYYEVLLRAVGERGGVVSDLAGDSMVAVWVAARRGDSTAVEACSAADALRREIERFNASRGHLGLPTRIGLDSGQLLLGNVGSEVRGEYRAVGDIVNTAARLQGLNRHLGTRILMTEATASGLTGFFTRPVGRFLLVGKKVPVNVFELPRRLEGNASDEPALGEAFAAALLDFQHGRWREAERGFAGLAARAPGDGPSRFYASVSEEFARTPPGEWDGVLRMSVK